MFKISQFTVKLGALPFVLGALLLAAAPGALADPAKPKSAPAQPTVVERAFQFADGPKGLDYLTATVTLTTVGSPKTLPKVVIGRGIMRMEGDLLQGKFDLTFDSAAKAPAGKNQLLFNVSRANRVGLQWLVNDKPLKYASLKAFDAQATPDSLTAKINWNDTDWLLSAIIERSHRVPAKGPRVPQTFPVPAKTDSKKPITIMTVPIKIKPAKKAVGRNFIVTGRFLVTNSEDGVGGIFGNADDRVELTGYVSINQKSVLSLNSDKNSATTGDSFDLKELRFGLRYDDTNLHYCSVKGSIADNDKASARDMLWSADRTIDLMQIMQSNREFVIKGDRKSESGDLYIRVTDGGEIME